MTTEDVSTDDKPAGRRERGKRDKRRRIVDAATALFAERGYSAVTTQEIADAADIGTGTLFRYVDSKAELLILVMNERLRLGTDQGVALAAAGSTPTEAILALLAPLADASLGHPENTVIYQRETLFGAQGPHRSRALAHVAAMEGSIRQILDLYAAGRPTRPGIDLGDVAHAIYASMYMDLVRVGVGRAGTADLPARLRQSVELLVHGLVDLPVELGPAAPGGADER